MAVNSAYASATDYEILGLKPTASPEDARNAYKALVKLWHPDRFPENSPAQLRAEERFKAINAAYQRIRHTGHAGSEAFSTQQPHTPPPKPDNSLNTTTTTKRGKGFQHPAGFRASLASVFSSGFAFLHRFWSGRNPRVRRFILISSVIALAILWIGTLPIPWPRDGHQGSSPAIKGPQSSPAGSAIAPRTPGEAHSMGRKPSSPSQPHTANVPPAREGPRRPPKSEISESSYFTLGSPKQEVLRLQGKPHKVHGQTWVYGLSEISFKEGRVSRYNNFDGSLNIRVLPTSSPPGARRPTFFSLGATEDEVLWVQGTPTRIDSNKWYYGFSEITFKDGRVVGFNNFFNTAQIRIQPAREVSTAIARGYFTVGSNQDEVLAIQGTPTGIQANIWSYQLSEVWFQDGKVRMVNNFSGNLKFVPPDLATD